MKFFLDTGNIEEIKEGLAMGMVDGVTTNPSLIAKENMDFDTVVNKILEFVKGPVSLEVIQEDADGMVKEGKKLASIASNVVVKIPLTVEGLKATKELSDSGIKVNQTLVFSPLQALLAAKAGASYISPFIGRLDDIAHYGMDLVEQILTIRDNYDFQCEVLVASVRNPLHVLDAAMMGADVATIPFSVMKQLANHPLTDAGVKKFLADWERVPKNRIND
ncbi:MAG: fructose-6-phosphate aldolase [Syntrophales bacterium]|jgi:transaldolase|nr:fructose-6-phosphate aldolase [Syntrophales bacterium]MDY0045250.1 fructose-6-phosphate aldolase [Syntrophales bacterium]